ncbi:MAG: acyltransferase, partial [Archangium sp.]|nr:acyltransferase [Archangium sp.]
MIRDAKHRLWTPVLHRYVVWKLQRAFRGLWVRGSVPPGDEPFITYSNHSNFWDGFVAYALLQRAGRDVYAVMEEQNLARFQFLS